MAHTRLSWIDLAKVVSICLVISYHTPPSLTGYTAQLIQLLRMPAFFLIAGFLFDDRKFPDLLSLLRHRARQLLIPYCCFEALLIPLTNHGLDEIGSATLHALLGHPTTCYPLWFLVCLFGMQVVHYLGTRLTTRLTGNDWTRHRYWLLGGYIVLSTALAHCDLPQHFQLNAIVTNLPFYAAANCCKDLVLRVSWRQYTTIAACLVGGLLLVGLKMRWLETNTGWWADSLYYLMHLTAGLLLLPPYIATCKAVGQAIGNRRLIEYLGSNTVVILALHTYYIIIINRCVGEVMLSSHAWANPLLTLLIALAHLPIIWMINRWTPWLLGRARQTADR